MPLLNNGYLYQNPKAILYFKVVDGFLKLLPRKKKSLPENPGKILCIKPDHLGDMLLFTSVLPLLRKRYPEARIDIAGNRWNRFILGNNPYIGKIYTINHYKANRENGSKFRKWQEYRKTLASAVREIRREKYDLCLFFRAYGNNLIPIVRKAECGYSIGHATGGYGPLLDRIVPWKLGIHETEHYLEVLQPLGIEARPGDLSPEIYPDETDSRKALSIYQNLPLNKGTKVAVIHPGAGDMRKSLPPEDWAKVIQKIEERDMPLCLPAAKRKRIFSKLLPGKNGRISGEIFPYRNWHPFLNWPI